MKRIWSNRIFIAISMLIVAPAFIAVLHFLPISVELKNVILDFSRNTYPFTIQNLMWIVFFFGLGELIHRFLYARKSGQELKMRFLPDDEQTIITNKQLGELYREIKDQKDNTLADLIKILIMQFQTSNSIQQTHSMLNSQVEMSTALLEVRYSMIRYIIWVIPTLGFIGTVIGIAMALSFAGSADPHASTFLKEITSRLGVAFYTTLVALLMSGLLVFLMHVIQSKEEEAILKQGKYCLDNFINRLYSTNQS